MLDKLELPNLFKESLQHFAAQSDRRSPSLFTEARPRCGSHMLDGERCHPEGKPDMPSGPASLF